MRRRSILRSIALSVSAGVVAALLTVAAPSAASAATGPGWQSPIAVGAGIDPLIRVDAKGTTHAVWRTFDRTRDDGDLYYARLAASSRTWTTPKKLSQTSSQRMSSPTFDLAIGKGGTIAVVWASSPRFGRVGDPYFRWSDDGGTTWSMAARLENASATDAVDSVTAEIGADGLVTLAWTIENTKTRATRGSITDAFAPGAAIRSQRLDTCLERFSTLTVSTGSRAMLSAGGLGDVSVCVRDAEGTWSEPEVISPRGWGFSQVGYDAPAAFLPDGSVALVWHGRQTYFSGAPLNGVVFARWDATTEKWSSKILRNVDIDLDADFEPQLVARGNRLAVVAVTPRSSAGESVVAWRSVNGGTTWTSRATVATSAKGNPRASLNADGALMIAWLEQGKASYERRVVARHMTAGGTLGPRVQLAALTDDRELKGFWPKSAGPATAFRPDGTAVFVWSDGDNVRSRAYARTLTAPTPKISGTAKVGKKLTARPGTWTSGTALTYQWYANGARIAGATKKVYTLKAAQRGTKIKVKVTGKKSGYTTTTKTSAATSTVK